jgi:hypothetical protein
LKNSILNKNNELMIKMVKDQKVNIPISLEFKNIQQKPNNKSKKWKYDYKFDLYLINPSATKKRSQKLVITEERVEGNSISELKFRYKELFANRLAENIRDIML